MNMLFEPPHFALLYAGRTDPGNQRTVNEDTFACDPEIGLFLVADGVGGKQAGEVASRAAAVALPALLRTRATEEPGELRGRRAVVILREMLNTLNEEIRERSRAYPELSGLGTTIVVAWVLGDVALIANAGDSRAYMLRLGRLRRLTRDDTPVEHLLRAKQISPREARASRLAHVIEQYLGKEGALSPAVRMQKIRHGDRILLCTDGLSGQVSQINLRRMLQDARDSDEACENLVAAANAAGGRDNVTALVIDVRDRAVKP